MSKFIKIFAGILVSFLLFSFVFLIEHQNPLFKFITDRVVSWQILDILFVTLPLLPIIILYFLSKKKLPIFALGIMIGDFIVFIWAVSMLIGIHLFS